MMVKTVLRHCLFLLFLVILSGCVAGQNIRMTYEPSPETAAAQDVAVSVQVSDDRPFVTSGNKPPSYIGHYRGGFGNTWDVNTLGMEPLAEMIQRDLGEDLQSMGFTLVPPEDSMRVVKVSIADWNFDTYINGKFWYDIRVRALDGAGKQLSEIRLQDTAVIEGSFWVGAKYAFEREMPILYRSIIRKMIREAPSMMAALKE
jgi:hypothetical protein